MSGGLTIPELRQLIASRPEEDPVSALGPFVLVRRPPPPVLAAHLNQLAARGTLPTARRGDDPVTLVLEFMIDLEVLQILPSGPGTQWVVGRNPACDLVVDEPSVSSRHLRISRQGSGYQALDLGSTNGTRVEQAEVLGVTPRSLPDGAVLGLGDADFWFLGMEHLLNRVLR